MPLSREVLANVPAPGRLPGVRLDTTIISSAEMIVIGTTGSNPSTIVPVAARVMTSDAADRQYRDATVPAAAAGPPSEASATASTAAAVQSVLASAPHLVLPFQNSAATSSGESAA